MVIYMFNVKSKQKQIINCDVNTCKYHNSKKNICKLEKIMIKNQTNNYEAKTKHETVCSNYYLSE